MLSCACYEIIEAYRTHKCKGLIHNRTTNRKHLFGKKQIITGYDIQGAA
jgi:hypothetical protein